MSVWKISIALLVVIPIHAFHQSTGTMQPAVHDISPPLKELQASSSETSPAVPIEKLIAPELRYRIVQEFGPIFFCDPDMHPVGHDDRPRALTAFPEIQKDVDTFRAITKNYRLDTIAEFSDIDKVTVYREYKKLSAVHLEPLGEKYKFSIRVRNDSSGPNNRNNGFQVDGLIDQKKQITVLKREPTLLTCPL